MPPPSEFRPRTANGPLECLLFSPLGSDGKLSPLRCFIGPFGSIQGRRRRGWAAGREMIKHPGAPLKTALSPFPPTREPSSGHRLPTLQASD
jgi:hypothetical protein